MRSPRPLAVMFTGPLVAALLWCDVARADPPDAGAPSPLAQELDRAARDVEADPRVRARPPAPTAEEMIPRMVVERYTLANGLDVVISPEPSAQQVYVEVEYHVGSGDCPEGRGSLAHLTEHLTYGPTRHLPEGLLVETERADATVYNGTTSTDRTRYFAFAPAGSLERLLWIESERMAFALDAITDAAVDHERRVVRNEYRQRVAGSSDGDLDLAVARELYPEGHLRRAPYDVTARIEDTTADDVRAFLRRWYVPANARLVVMGRVEVADARALVSRYFGDVARMPAPNRERSLTPPTLSGERVLRYRVPAGPERVQLVWPSPAFFAPGDAELDVLAEYSTWRQDGPMHRALVTAGLATSLTVGQHSYRDTSEFVIEASVAPGHQSAEVLDVIDRELARIRREGPEPDRLAATVTYVRRHYVSRENSFAHRIGLVSFDPDPADPGHLHAGLALYGAVTARSLRDTVTRWLPPERRLVVLLRPDRDAPASGVLESVRSR